MNTTEAKMLLSITDDVSTSINEQHENLVFELKKKLLFQELKPALYFLKIPHWKRLAEAEVALGWGVEMTLPFETEAIDKGDFRQFELWESKVKMAINQACSYLQLSQVFERYCGGFGSWVNGLEALNIDQLSDFQQERLVKLIEERDRLQKVSKSQA